MICAQGEWRLALPILTDVHLNYFTTFLPQFHQNSLHCKTCLKLLLFFEILSTLRQKKNTCLHNLHNANSSSKEKRYFLPHFRVAVHQNPRLQQSILYRDKEQKLSVKFIFDGIMKLFVGIFRTPLQQVIHGNLASAKFHLSLEFEWCFPVLSGKNAQNGNDDVS